MKSRLTIAACLAAMGMAFATPASAQMPTDKKTFFTFSEAVELPGYKTIPAGRYIFRLADSPSNRYIVQVMSEDGQQMFATLLAISTQRADVPDEAEIAFMETAENQPPAVKIWWYPGESNGREFIYPREQAMRLARATNSSVLTTTTDTDDAGMRTADTTYVGPNDVKTADAEQTAPAADTSAPSAVSTQTARTETVEPVATSGERSKPAAAPRETRPARRTLPQTASGMPLIGLLGLLSIASAFGIRKYARSRA